MCSQKRKDSGPRHLPVAVGANDALGGAVALASLPVAQAAMVVAEAGRAVAAIGRVAMVARDAMLTV